MMRSLLQKSVSLLPWGVRTKIKDIPFLGTAQRSLLKRFAEGQEFAHRVDRGPAAGLRYPVTLPQDKGIWTGTYEVDLSERIAGAVRPGDVCLDVGGWHGFFAGVMALHGASKVLIFEPLPDNATQIRKMLKMNPDLPIELFQMAIATAAGIQQFREMRETSMAKLSSSEFQQSETGEKLIEVKVETLDRLRESGVFPRAHVIKIDVEGTEEMVLRGAEVTLKKDRPVLFIEIHSRALARNCTNILCALEYRIEVLETGKMPDFTSEPEVCHFAASPRN